MPTSFMSSCCSAFASCWQHSFCAFTHDRQAPRTTMPRNKRPSKTGLEVSHAAEAAEQLQQLMDDTTSKKAHNEQAAYMFGFKCFLPASQQDERGEEVKTPTRRPWTILVT